VTGLENVRGKTALPPTLNASGSLHLPPCLADSRLMLPAVAKGSMSKSQSRPPLGPRLRTPEAAKYIGIADSTLEKMRVTGTGPEFEKPAAKVVVYSIPALEEYMAQRRARSTSEAGKPAPKPRRRKNTNDSPRERRSPKEGSPDRSDDEAT
jgi:hypothetical protein